MEDGIPQADSRIESEMSHESAQVVEPGNPVENAADTETNVESVAAPVTEDADEKTAESDNKTGNPEIQTKVKRIGLAALILSAGILCSRLLGFVRDAVIAYQAGAGIQTDAYNAAFLLPDIMNHFLAFDHVYPAVFGISAQERHQKG